MLHPEGEIGMLDSKEENGILALQRDCHGLLCMGNWHALLCIGACYAVLCRGDPYNALQGILPCSAAEEKPMLCHPLQGEFLSCLCLFCRGASAMPCSALQESLSHAFLHSAVGPLRCHALLCGGSSTLPCPVLLGGLLYSLLWRGDCQCVRRGGGA